jgi:hypothetical protein
MRKKCLFFIVLFALIHSGAISQNDETDRHFSISASAGVVTLIQGTYAFNFRYLSSQYTPGFSGSVGVSYGDFLLVSPSELQFSVEFKYTRLSTEDPAPPNAYSQMRLSQYAGIVWAKIKVPSRISPSVRFGLGATNFKYEEEFTDIGDKISAEYRSPTFAFGAALDITIATSTVISPYADVTITLKSQSVQSVSGRYGGTIGKFLIPSYGIRFEMNVL